MSDERKIALSDLSPKPGARQSARRVGRGPGSGRGKTSGRGHKGQKSRSGGSLPPWFEGGQMPLYRRVPKRGFKPLNKVERQVVNVGQLADLAETEITPDLLRAHGLVGSEKRPVKILATGELNRAVAVRAHEFSGAARQKIEAAGGSAEVIDFRAGGESSD